MQTQVGGADSRANAKTCKEIQTGYLLVLVHHKPTLCPWAFKYKYIYGTQQNKQSQAPRILFRYLLKIARKCFFSYFVCIFFLIMFVLNIKQPLKDIWSLRYMQKSFEYFQKNDTIVYQISQQPIIR